VPDPETPWSPAPSQDPSLPPPTASPLPGFGAPPPTHLHAPPLSRRRHPRELAVVALLVLSVALAVAGLGLTAVQAESFDRAGSVAETASVLALLGAALSSVSLDTLRHLRAARTGGHTYDVLRGTRRLRMVSMLLQLLEVTATIVLALLLANAGHFIDLAFSQAVVENGLAVLSAALCIAGAAALDQSLRTPVEGLRTPLSSVLAGLAIGAAIGLGAVGAAAALGGAHVLDAWVHLGPHDAAALVLAASLAIAFALVRLRRLPTLTNLVWAQSGRDPGRPLGAGRASAVFVPAILAFALMIVVFLLFLLFGIGVGDVLLSAGRNPLLLGVLLFLVVALLACLVVAFALARSARGDTALYKILPGAEVRRRRLILGSSGLLAFFFALGAAASFLGYLPRAGWIHFLCFALLAGLGPYGFYRAREHNRIRRLEERFPDFLRDIASGHKGGLTLHQAAAISAKGEYGDLTPEVRKMADQLSWNVSFSEALQRFSDRVQTPLVQRAVSLILQADRSGGATTDVLLTAAKDAREIKNLENERRTTMSLYTIVVYITFFVFLGVAAVLYGQFAPQIVASSRAVQELGAAGTGVHGLSGNALALDQYQLFYFMAAVVQAVGDGVVAGLLGTGKAVLGLRHSFIMVAVSYVVFAFLL
jgi:flagellar protein FlaJ